MLWSLRYEQKCLASSSQPRNDNGIINLPSLSSSLALEDEILENVKTAWQHITGEEGEAFMKFEAREGIGEDEE